MNNLFKYSIIILIIAACLFSCESDEEFLTEVPKTFYTLDNAISSPSQVEQLLITCYTQLRSLKANSESTDTRILSGNGTDVMDVPLSRNSQHFSDYSKLNPLSSRYNSIYSTFFVLVSRANTALYAADYEKVKWSSEQEKRSAIAQAKFFRAYGYRNLGELFGGVPIVDEVIFTPKYDFERSTRTETYQFAIDDLESALDDFPVGTAAAGKIVKGAAQHYLSELYLALGIELEDNGQNGDAMFNKAIEYASAVIDGPYSLMTERFGTRKDKEPGDVFWDLFQKGNINYQDGNTECIWAYQIDFDAHVAEDGGSALWYPRGYCFQKQYVPGMILSFTEFGDPRAVAWTSPTAYVINDIWEGELGNDIRNSENNIKRTYVYNKPDFEKYGESWNVSEYMIQNKGQVYPNWAKNFADQYMDVGSGYATSRLFRDEYAIRLPETILLRAEAYWRVGNNQNAADDINKLRNRAQCQYLVSAGDVTLDFILDERARELFYEEARWNTLLRMGGTVAVDRLREHAYWPNPNISQTLNFDFNLWPIPQEVIDRNKDVVLEQNPGWRDR
ncbi:MAG: RagB/SusD family nutrient uptake outer membrane protein [Bacteroidetes bacterium]|nr:RagB/SusD family nutrient uptake outer membrane protein [Bacteroidota bacterium]